MSRGRGRPTEDPIGLEVSTTGRLLQRAFDEQLMAAGGSVPVWLVVTALKRSDHAMQRDLAASIGIEGATLTHHLNRMERAGLVERRRDPLNRRNQTVALTTDGEAFFERLLTAVVAFDRQLRDGFSDDELKQLRGLLGRLRANASTIS
jgi:MarR family transcriptional regulator, transcriptional regulator for hemolysin